MSKDLSAKYCHNNIERLPKKLVKDIKVFLKKKKWQHGHKRDRNLPDDQRKMSKNALK